MVEAHRVCGEIERYLALTTLHLLVGSLGHRLVDDSTMYEYVQ